MNNTKWLALATSDYRESLSKIFKGNAYEFAIDGFRAHITELDSNAIESENIDTTHQEIVRKLIEISQRSIVIEHFSINPVCLLEALSIWSENTPDQPIEIEYCYDNENGNNFIRIRNRDHEDSRIAIIMCMRSLEKETE